MTFVEVSTEIERYLSQKEQAGALLITGKWGSGKTYLVKKIISRINEDGNYAIGMISLFGLTSIGEIKDSVNEVYVSFCVNSSLIKANKLKKKTAKLVKDATEVISSAASGNIPVTAVSKGLSALVSTDFFSFFEVRNTVGKNKDNPSGRPFALVFDDFERCKVDIEDRIGVINEFLENKHIKTIIIADEEKIEEEKYREIKEKLISRTIRLSVDDLQMISAIVDEYRTNNEMYKAFLEDHKSVLFSAFRDSSYNNLRALKVCLCEFERVYETWVKTGIRTDEMRQVLYRFCAVVFEARAGNFIKDDHYSIYVLKKPASQNEGKNKTAQIEDKYLQDTFRYFFDSLLQWIVTGDWNERAFIEELRRRYETEELSHEQKFVYYSFWDLQQEDITVGMPALVGRANKGEASRDELISLLKKTHILKRYGIDLPCEVDYAKIEQGLKTRMFKLRSMMTHEPESRTFTTEDQIDTEAIDILRMIEAMEDKLIAWKTRLNFIFYLDGEEDISPSDLKYHYMEEFDDELKLLFLNAFRKAPNERKREMAIVLHNMIFDEIRTSTVGNIQKTIQNFIQMNESLGNEINADMDVISIVIVRETQKMLDQMVADLRIKITECT